MKKLVLILLSLLVCLNLFGCGGESVTLPEAEEIIEETTPITTSRMYVITEEHDIDNEYNGMRYSYNDQGELVVITQIGVREFNFTYGYFYDDAGNITEIRRFENGLLQQILKLDTVGKIYEEITYSGGEDRRAGIASEYIYDEDGKITKITRYCETFEPEHLYDEVDETCEYFYGDDGVLVKELIYDDEETCIYYNAYRLPVLEVKYDSDKKIDNFVIYEYEYDSLYPGKPISQKKYANIYTSVVREFLDSEDPNKNAADYEGAWRLTDDDITSEDVFVYEWIDVTEEQEKIIEAKRNIRLNHNWWYEILYW